MPEQHFSHARHVRPEDEQGPGPEELIFGQLADDGASLPDEAAVAVAGPTQSTVFPPVVPSPPSTGAVPLLRDVPPLPASVFPPPTGSQPVLELPPEQGGAPGYAQEPYPPVLQDPYPPLRQEPVSPAGQDPYPPARQDAATPEGHELSALAGPEPAPLPGQDPGAAPGRKAGPFGRPGERQQRRGRSPAPREEAVPRPLQSPHSPQQAPPRRASIRAEQARPVAIKAPPLLPAELLALRASIDNFDAALVHLLAERFKCTQRVGQLKAELGLEPSDPARESEQVTRLRSLAAAAGLDPVFAEKFLAFVVAEVIRHHEEIAERA